jgi:hypothetical protein
LIVMSCLRPTALHRAERSDRSGAFF